MLGLLSILEISITVQHLTFLTHTVYVELNASNDVI